MEAKISTASVKSIDVTIKWVTVKKRALLWLKWCFVFDFFLHKYHSIQLYYLLCSMSRTLLTRTINAEKNGHEKIFFVYFNMDECFDSLLSEENIREIRQQSLSLNRFHLVASYSNIGQRFKRSWQNALRFNKWNFFKYIAREIIAE
jgi:hypothetical protein